jgi:formylglycine-generating enzyme required for sulfatase activity/proteasome lid subunit RPN8/RPN11
MSNSPGGQGSIVFPPLLYKQLLDEVTKRYPQKVFGYILSDAGTGEPADFIIFEENIRNSKRWQPEFHSYGRYFINHADAGFVATPAESWRVQKEIWTRGLREIAVFHTHQRHPANFSKIDWDMHRQRFCDLWHLIISLRNPQFPQMRAFGISGDGVRELPLRVAGERDKRARPAAVTRDAAIARVRTLSNLGPAGHPDLARAEETMAAIDVLSRCAHADTVREVLSEGLLRGSAERYEDYIAPYMTQVGSARFDMGTDQASARHFYGESPRHACSLPAFEIMRNQVTADLFWLIEDDDPKHTRTGKGRPVVEVTWAEAALFALWMGCRLPTEAEWEYCCGAGSAADWCCESEEQLPRYAWYSANAGDEVQPVAVREPNALGLFDMHGNVWEWCLDDYDQDFYRRAPTVSPLNLANDPGGAGSQDKVVRGGSMNALAEMCRTRYRFHEPTGFRAADLGFRLARTCG